MSIDLDWTGLDTQLADHLIDILNKQLANATRPSFIGPIEVLALEFGSTAPDIEIVDIRDIYRDFLESDDDNENKDNAAAAKPTSNVEDGEEDFEWVSRRGVGRGMAPEGPAYHHLPPHIRYGRGPSADFFSDMAGISRTNMWQGGIMSLPNLRDLTPRFPPPSFTGGLQQHTPNPLTLETLNGSITGPNVPLTTPDANLTPESTQDDISPPHPEQEQPNVQLHFRVEHSSDLRLTLTTSMLINYPSPMFMALPIKLSVTGLIFSGEVVVAYEGSKKRVHICILDDLDPYCPSGDRSTRAHNTPTPPDPDGPLPHRFNKPPPVGNRLLPSIFIESEIGQADKHVLKNVTRVERFIQDIIRKNESISLHAVSCLHNEKLFWYLRTFVRRQMPFADKLFAIIRLVESTVYFPYSCSDPNLIKSRTATLNKLQQIVLFPHPSDI